MDNSLIIVRTAIWKFFRMRFRISAAAANGRNIVLPAAQAKIAFPCAEQEKRCSHAIATILFSAGIGLALVRQANQIINAGLIQQRKLP